jgi:hypothetical protein
MKRFLIVLCVAAMVGLASAAAHAAIITWNFTNAGDYYVNGDPGVVEPGNQVEPIGGTPGTPETGNPSAISYMPVITVGSGAYVPARPWINYDDDAPYGSDWASVFAKVNTQAPGLRVGDITGGGFTLTGMNNPAAVYDTIRLSPTGGDGSTVLILLSPMSYTGTDGNLNYTFDLNTHADYRTDPTGLGNWSAYDPARSGTFGQVIGMLSGSTDYAAFVGPEIGLSNTSGTTFTVTQIALDTIPEPASIIIWSLFGLGTVFGVRVWRRGRKTA